MRISSAIIIMDIRMKNHIEIIMAASFSLLITFTFHMALSNKRASNSVFQHMVADTFHRSYLFVSCSMNKGVNMSSTFTLSVDEKINGIIVASCPILFLALIRWYGLKMLHRLLLGILTILNVWLLARWCDSFDIWYSVDILTVYLLVWQFSYLISEWCFHQLSWLSLIFYQASVCIFLTIPAFIFYDLFLRYFPSINLVIFWIDSIYDIFQCLHIDGRFRNQHKETSTNIYMPTYPNFASFYYYTHDIEDGADTIQHYEVLGGGAFFMYNLLLLCLLPPLSSTTIQFCVLLGFIINIQIGLMLTKWIGSVWKVSLRPAVYLPVILISTYTIIIDLIIQSLDIDNVKILS